MLDVTVSHLVRAIYCKVINTKVFQKYLSLHVDYYCCQYIPYKFDLKSGKKGEQGGRESLFVD